MLRLLGVLGYGGIGFVGAIKGGWVGRWVGDFLRKGRRLSWGEIRTLRIPL